jgi:hypothetical protein
MVRARVPSFSPAYKTPWGRRIDNPLQRLRRLTGRLRLN